MSGGRFNYKQYHIEHITEEVERVIETCADEFTHETLDEFRNGVRALRLAAIYAQRIDWLLSGDDGEEAFHKRLNKERGVWRDDNKRKIAGDAHRTRNV